MGLGAEAAEGVEDLGVGFELGFEGEGVIGGGGESGFFGGGSGGSGGGEAALLFRHIWVGGREAVKFEGGKRRGGGFLD